MPPQAFQAQFQRPKSRTEIRMSTVDANTRTFEFGFACLRVEHKVVFNTQAKKCLLLFLPSATVPLGAAISIASDDDED